MSVLVIDFDIPIVKAETRQEAIRTRSRVPKQGRH